MEHCQNDRDKNGKNFGIEQVCFRPKAFLNGILFKEQKIKQYFLWVYLLVFAHYSYHIT